MKLMIVDDEVIIRTGLTTVINWEELGFKLLPSAESAEQALEIIRVDPPHILLTDIRMGGMDGLELSYIVKKLYPDMEIVILSGYDDFEYVQKALRGGIGDYLLKSSRPEEIIKAVMKAKYRIEHKRESVKEETKRNSAFRDQVLDTLLNGEKTEEEYHSLVNVLPALFDQHEGREVYQVVILSPSGWGDSPFYEGLLLFAVHNMLSEQLPCETLQRKDHLVAVIRSSGSLGDQSKIKSSFSALEKLLKCRLFAAVGGTVITLNELNRSYEEALAANSYKGLPGIDAYVAFDDIKDRQGIRIVCSNEEESELAGLLRNGDPIALRHWVSRTINRQLHEPQVTPQSLQAYFNCIVLSGFRWLERALDSVGLEPANVGRDPVVFDLANDLEEQLFKQIQCLLAYYKDAVSTDKTSYVRKATAYIKENLNTELSLQQVSKYVHLHPNHFSEMFRRETGTTYIEFVKRERIKRAAEIINETDAKVAEVAEQVGYGDVKYFTKLFKQYTGMTPSEYRRKT